MMGEFHRVPWRHHTNIYEVNLRQYSREGTFKMFEAELPRLHDMGVEVLWFMPVTPISQINRKGTLGSYYACADFFSTNPEFGTLDDFRELVEKIHALGMKVIIDWVANHTGWDHSWTQLHPAYYLRDHEGNFYEKNGWEDVIDLNYENHEMCAAMIEAMRFWVTDCDIDGFRCDMAMLIPLSFWREARRHLDPTKPLFWFAELDQWYHTDYLEVFDACYTWKWMYKTKEFYQLRNLGLDGLYAVLVHYGTLHPKTAIRAWFTSNHDENSWNGTEYEKYGEMALPLAVFSCTWDGIPLIYSGQEKPNHKRLLFFDRDPINWKGGCSLHDFYKKLLHLHSTHPALRAADQEVRTYHLHTSADQQVFAYLKRNKGNEVMVLLNFSSRFNLDVEIRDEQVSGYFTELFSQTGYDFDIPVRIRMKAWQYLVLVK